MSRKPAKTRHGSSIKPKRNNARTTSRPAGSSVADLQEQVGALTRELAEAREQQTATSEVLHVISSSYGELAPVFKTMLENATRLCEVESASLVLREGGDLRFVARYNVPAALLEQMERDRLGPASGIGRSVRLKQIVQVPDMVNDQAYFDREPARVRSVEAGYRSQLSVPLIKDNEAIGAFNMLRKKTGLFTNKHIELVQNFAAQAVIAIENTRLLNELRESLQQQTATADVLKVISRSAFELQPVFESVAESAVRLCGADKAFVWRIDGELLRMVVAYNASPELEEFIEKNPIRPGRETTAGRAALEHRTIQIPDVEADPEYRYGSRITNPVRTTLAVPILKDDDLLGMIGIYRLEVRPFTDKQIALLETFADQAVIAIENVRLFEAEQQRTRELGEALEQQTATAEVLRVISSSPGELEPVFETMLANAVQICGAKFGVMSLSEGGDVFRVIATHGAPAAFVEQRRRDPLVRPTPGHNLERMVRTKDVVHVPDISADPESAPILAKFGGAKALVNVPLIKDGDLVGSLVIFRQEAGPFTDKQIGLVKNFAAQAVIAIENTRLLNELRESLQQQTATSEVLSVISSSPGELEPVFRTMLQNAIRVCDAKFGILFRYDGELSYPVAWVDTPPALAELQRRRGPFRPEPGTLLARVLQTRQLAHTADYAAEPKPGNAAKLGGARSTLVVPMLKDEELVGAIIIYRQEVRPFTDKQIELVQNFASQAVIAIENTRLLNELRESLQQQTATADVLKVISRSAFDLQAVLNTLVESAARLCDADIAAISWQKEASLHWATTYGLPPEHAEYLKNIPIERGRGSVTGRVLLEGKTVQVPDVLADQEYAYSEFQRRAGYRTILGIPLLREGIPIGIVLLMRRTVRIFTDKQVELATTFADQAGIAIKNVQLFDEIQQKSRQLAEASQHKHVKLPASRKIAKNSKRKEDLNQLRCGKVSRKVRSLNSRKSSESSKESSSRSYDASRKTLPGQVSAPLT
jgi:two-component system, NtrC family, sensor kinase